MFELLKTDTVTQARLGRLTTAHGVVDTPVYMPVGTQASVKAMDPRELLEMRHPNHPRQHLPPEHPAGAGDHHRRRRPPSVHELAPADPDRQRRLPGFQPGQDSQNQGPRRGVPFASWTGRRCFWAPRKAWPSSARWARTSRWSSMNVRRTTPRRASSGTPWNAPSAGRANAANSRAPRDKGLRHCPRRQQCRVARGMRAGDDRAGF